MAPMSFETYGEIRLFAGAIRRTTQDISMALWFADSHVGQFSNDPSLRSDEIGAPAAWAEAKSPAGDTKDARPSRRWAESWSIPKADLVSNMTQAVALPASGDIEYTYQIVPTNFKEDRRVQMAEVLPTLRSNVHHALVYVRPPDSNWQRHAPIGVPFTPATLADPEDRRGAHLDGQRRSARLCAGEFSGGVTRKNGGIYSCGLRPCFSNTYIANGRAAADQSSIELIFSKPAPEQRVLTLQLTNDHFMIPPSAPD